jgi:hypothetical protein
MHACHMMASMSLTMGPWFSIVRMSYLPERRHEYHAQPVWKSAYFRAEQLPMHVDQMPSSRNHQERETQFDILGLRVQHTVLQLKYLCHILERRIVPIRRDLMMLV